MNDDRNTKLITYHYNFDFRAKKNIDIYGTNNQCRCVFHRTHKKRNKCAPMTKNIIHVFKIITVVVKVEKIDEK